MDLIKVNNGDFYFGKFHALKAINLNIKKGDRIALIGHNGAGKSTLLDVLIGIKKLAHGSIKYTSKDFKDKLGVQFQAKEFPQSLKFRSLLSFYLSIYKIKRHDPNIEKLLQAFKVKHLLNRNLQNLSGGQKQKISIMFALINQPEVIVLDEILTALDITSQSQIINLLSDYLAQNKHLTVISASHNETEIEKLVDNLVVLEKGQIIKTISKKAVLKKYGSIVNFMTKLGEKSE